MAGWVGSSSMGGWTDQRPACAYLTNFEINTIINKWKTTLLTKNYHHVISIIAFLFYIYFISHQFWKFKNFKYFYSRFARAMRVDLKQRKSCLYILFVIIIRWKFWNHDWKVNWNMVAGCDVCKAVHVVCTHGWSYLLLLYVTMLASVSIFIILYHMSSAVLRGSASWRVISDYIV